MTDCGRVPKSTDGSCIRSHFSCRQEGAFCILQIQFRLSKHLQFSRVGCLIRDLNIKASSATSRRQARFLIAPGHSMIFRTRRYLIISEPSLTLRLMVQQITCGTMPPSLVHLPLPSLSRDRVIQGSPLGPIRKDFATSR